MILSAMYAANLMVSYRDWFGRGGARSVQRQMQVGQRSAFLRFAAPRARDPAHSPCSPRHTNLI